jgi:hypothetical protein
MPSFGLTALRVAAALVLVSSLSCKETTDAPRPVDLTGTWQGILSRSSGGTGGSTTNLLSLRQAGATVTGTLGADATILGTVDRTAVSLTLNFAGLCAETAAGTATLERLPDRDRLRLTYHGSSTCSGAIGGAGQFDRMRCPPPASACAAPAGLVAMPSCIDLSTDRDNCGGCGIACGGDLQVCVAGACTIPACTGPVPLQAPVPIGTGADRLWALALADMNGDGGLDALVSGFLGDAAGVVRVLRNDGAGAFDPQPGAALWPRVPDDPFVTPSALAVGNLGGAGGPNVAAYVAAPTWPDASEGEVVTLLEDGDGSLREGERFPTGRDDSILYLGAKVVALADLNRDGADDLVARSGRAAAVQVRLGRGDGTLGPKQEYAVPVAPKAIAAADLDGDGIVDLATAADHASFGVPPILAVLRGNGDGTFAAARESPGVPAPNDIAAADLDEDGVPDLIIASWFAGAPHRANAWVLLGNGDGTFQEPAAIANDPVSWTWTLAVVDLDGDGHQDVVLGDRGHLDLLRGNGDGTFAAALEYPVSDGADLVSAADLDGDGRPDLLVGITGGGGQLTLLRPCAP